MQNRINQIMLLPDGKKHLIIDQAIYNETSYFLTCRLNENNKITNEISVVEEVIANNDTYVRTVKDPDLFQKLLEYFYKNL